MPLWKEIAAKEAWEKAQARLELKKQADRYKMYQNDPVLFGTEVLRERYTDDVIRVMESVRDNPITIARSANAVGKSHSAARICVWFYTVYNDAKVFLAAAPPLENLKKILWGEISTVVRAHPELFEGHKRRSLDISRDFSKSGGIVVADSNIVDTLESFITGVAIPTSGTSAEREGKFSGKHAPHLLFVVDEGDAVPDEVYKGIESCMSGGMARLLIMFNPRAQVGPVYRKESTRQANVVHLSAMKHPNVITGKDIIPGAVNREITVRRILEWTRPIGVGEKAVPEHLYTPPDFLVGYKSKSLAGVEYPPLTADERIIVEPQFYYMVLGIYPAQSTSQLISEAWINAAVKRWEMYVARHGEVPPTGVEPIMGLDMAELGADSNVACFRYGGYVPRLTIWNGVDPDFTAHHAYELYKKKQASIAMIDATGVGASVAPSMARRGRAAGLDVRAVSVKASAKPSPTIRTDRGDFYQLRDQLWWALREWLRADPSSMIPPDGLLIEELKAVEILPMDNTKLKITGKKDLRQILHRSTDRSDALCLTFAPFERPTWIRVGDEAPTDVQNVAMSQLLADKYDRTPTRTELFATDNDDDDYARWQDE